jgi:hypothetical protein
MILLIYSFAGHFRGGFTMKSTILFTFLLGLSLNGAASEMRFKYQPKTGQCLDSKGQPGFNSVADTDLMRAADEITVNGDGSLYMILFKNRNGECADLRNIDFDSHLRRPEYKVNYMTFANWNLKGARLNGATIAWSNGDLSLQGADVTGIKGGYVIIDATFDRFTKGLGTCVPETSTMCHWRF